MKSSPSRSEASRDVEQAPARRRVDDIEKRAPSLHLDILEDVFGRLWRRWHPATGASALEPGGTHADAAARLANGEAALSAVAGAFAGRRVTVRPAELAGGVLESVVLLPRFIEFSPDPAVNRDFLFVRAGLSGAIAAEGLVPDLDEPEVLRRALDAAVRVAREFDGFRARFARAARLELDTRPAPDELPEHEQPLERLRQAALRDGAALDGGPETPKGASGFTEELLRYRACAATSAGAPEPSFWRRLMRSRPEALQGPGPSLLFGGSMTPTDRDEAGAAMSESSGSGISDDAVEREAPVKDHVRQTTVQEDDYKANMPTHSFEKVDFADNYEGGYRRMDGDNDLEEQGESLDAVDLREMIRGGPEVATIYNAEIGDVGRIPDVEHVLPGERGVAYDEWDQASRSYRRDWVTLYPTRIDGCYPNFGRELAREVASTTRHAIGALERRRTERIARNRQLDGDEVDLDGVIEEYAERRRGGTPPGRLYIHSPRLERDVATCVMLDVSFSADSWVDNRRVLDVELAAACVLGAVAEEFEDQLSILAFASNTRNLCRTWTVKGWKDSWATGRARLGALKPQGYTRIGPAVRHATAELVGHSARKRHLILITDAKPTDFDRYEGGHGVHDVAWAVREARRDGVAVHALGIDPRAASMLPVMFGPGGWQILRHLGELPEALVEAYG